jgi:SAM-dependent methyltransferase
MGKSLAEVHALERAHWDALVPEAFDPASHETAPSRRDSLPRRLLASASDFLGELRGRRVVEVGCGLGDLTLELAREGAHVTAIDLSPRSIGYLRRRATCAGVADAIETHVAAAERLPLFDESFDLALGHRVARCVKPELAAPEIQRVLRPGGHALLSEPLGVAARPRLRLLAGREARPGAAHPWPPAEELERWTAGFSHCEVRCVPLPREPMGASGRVWRRLPTTWLERLPALRRDHPHALLLLTR